MSGSTGSSRNWAIILAGGEGKRTQELTRVIAGEPLPKQFCSFFGGRTLLAQTRERVAPLFPEECTLFALNRAHESYFGPELEGAPANCRVVQPSNRGTAAAIALCVHAITRRDRDAVVAIFPSDHHYVDSDAFRTSVGTGVRLAAEYPHSLLLLGAKPSYPETEYGWIEPGRALALEEPMHVFKVSRFWEKPNLEQSERLMQSECLWNTFVVMGYAWAFLELFRATMPNLVPLIDQACRSRQLDDLYCSMQAADFSRAVLAPMARRLLVLRGPDSGWTDLGNPRRVTEALTREGITPSWLPAAVHAGVELAAAGR